MIRRIGAVLSGIVAAVLLFMVAESINNSLHPFPKTLDLKDTKAVGAFMEAQPIDFWLLVLGGWLVGSIVCGLLIRIIGRSTSLRSPLIAGIVLTLSAVLNFVLLPHPTWFIVCGLVLFIPGTLLGFRLVKQAT